MTPRGRAPRDGVMVVGPVTWDLVGDRRVPGGTVSYAARTATAMGVRARVLTAAGPDADLAALEGHEVHVVPVEHTLTLRHTFRGAIRDQTVVHTTGRRLRPSDAPASWPTPAVLIVAPLLPDDLDPAAFAAVDADECCVTGQGYLRQVDRSGAISVPGRPTDALMQALAPSVSLFLSHEEVDTWPDAARSDVVARVRRLVVTRGARGADVVTARGTHHVDPVPATAVDSTGAGDVFAAAFILAVGEGETTACRLAAAYAAAAVEVSGAAPLPDRARIEARTPDR